MFKAYTEMWKRYFDFEGKSNRPAFWYVVLINVIIYAVLGVLTAVIPAITTVLGIIDGLYGLAILIPSLALVVRRLRDAGKHWANIFWVLLPIVGEIILIVYFCKPSQK